MPQDANTLRTHEAPRPASDANEPDRAGDGGISPALVGVGLLGLMVVIVVVAASMFGSGHPDAAALRSVFFTQLAEMDGVTQFERDSSDHAAFLFGHPELGTVGYEIVAEVGRFHDADQTARMAIRVRTLPSLGIPPEVFAQVFAETGEERVDPLDEAELQWTAAETFVVKGAPAGDTYKLIPSRDTGPPSPAQLWHDPVAATPAGSAIDKPEPTIVGLDNNPQVVLVTSLGEITLELFEDEMPNAVANFIYVTESGQYDDLRFHRIMSNFMLQGGDPNSKGGRNPQTWGQGDASMNGRSYALTNETNTTDFDRPMQLAYANSGANTSSAQFFITFAPTPLVSTRVHNPRGNYMILGQVVAGQAIVRAFERVETTRNASGENSVPLDPPVLEYAYVKQKRDRDYMPEVNFK